MSKASNEFENSLCEYFGQFGFWSSIFPKRHDGSQPADIIALNRKGKHLIDAKDCVSGRFVLNRMEDNQIHAMEWFAKKCGGNGWFAVKFPDDSVYIIPIEYLQRLHDEGIKSITTVPQTFSLENWINGNIDN